MMKALTLPELHAAELDILKDIDAFCRPRGIRYSLAFGTLLGAARHKGFIPWDDDIDLVMPREDYRRFQAEYVSERYSFIDRDNSPECYISFGRVTDTRRTLYASSQPWHSPALSTGAWVDIFPMDAVPDDPEEYGSLYRSLNRLLKMMRKTRRMVAPRAPQLPWMQQMKSAFKKMGHPHTKSLDPSALARDYMVTLDLATREPTGHLGLLCSANAPTYYFERSVFEEYVDLPFEDGLFQAPARYDLVLRTVYGDYMQLPPKDQQKPDLDRIGKMFWR